MHKARHDAPARLPVVAERASASQERADFITAHFRCAWQKFRSNEYANAYMRRPIMRFRMLLYFYGYFTTMILSEAPPAFYMRLDMMISFYIIFNEART